VRSVLEKVTAPLEHLLRNALAHGIETPEERRAAGKAEFGEIVLSARQSGNEMMLTVKDDGAGLNYARIREKAEAGGLLLPGVEPTETLLAQMIFAAGFSTAETISQVAGRGVGMDVVKSEISALGGRIDIASTPGAGTSFHIYLPLTLAMTQAVMIQAARHDYALPTPLVQQVLELRPEELEKAMAAGEVTWRGARYPFSYLPHLLDQRCRHGRGEERNLRAGRPHRHRIDAGRRHQLPHLSAAHAGDDPGGDDPGGQARLCPADAAGSAGAGTQAGRA
ncbi:MAG: ATP-binding protein, partial [Candidatus Thermoplasmatota archaeon]|nr:ATP-binding protein [Candidatus Thermoplasmatota archaeon]